MIPSLTLYFALILLLYAWVLYPLVLLALTRSGRRPIPAPVPNDFLPSVCVLISAHNEEGVIVPRLKNLMDLDYPPDRVRVFVGVDGSDDRTADLARQFAAAYPCIRVHAVAQRRGKTAMLKDLARLADEGQRPEDRGQRSEVRGQNRESQDSGLKSHPAVLIFSDANTMFDRDALRVLVGGFADPAVGGVCGQLVLHRSATSRTAEGKYWQMERVLKERESRLDSCLGANGAIYAVRQELFWSAIPDSTIIDDFVIGMKVREQGYRMVYEVSAKAHEDLPETVAHEWRRRVRIGTGDFQSLSLCRRCLLPRYGRFAWTFFSHKVLRWFTPHLLILFFVFGIGFLASAAAKNAPLRGGLLFSASLGAAGAAFLLAGAAGWALRRAKAAALRPFQSIAYFLAIQAALFVGFLRYCRGNLAGAWERTERRTVAE